MANYTRVEDLDVPALTDRYRLHDARISPLNGGAANSSFRLGAREGEFVLTVLDNHDPASAQQLAARTQRLFDLGIPTTEVVPDRRGDLAPVVDTKPVLLKVWIEGRVVDPLPKELLPAAGALLARLHTVPADIPDLPVGTRRLSDDHEARIAEFPDRAFASWLTSQLKVVKEHLKAATSASRLSLTATCSRTISSVARSDRRPSSIGRPSPSTTPSSTWGWPP